MAEGAGCRVWGSGFGVEHHPAQAGLLEVEALLPHELLARCALTVVAFGVWRLTESCIRILCLGFARIL